MYICIVQYITLFFKARVLSFVKIEKMSMSQIALSETSGYQMCTNHV